MLVVISRLFGVVFFSSVLAVFGYFVWNGVAPKFHLGNATFWQAWVTTTLLWWGVIKNVFIDHK